MRPPRLLIFVFCLIFLPILLTFFSALSSSSHVATPSALAGPTTGLHALFSFNIPSSLFPPSAIISLTDDNSTFFLARPAAFGPLLPEKGFSGPLWVGSGFGEAGPAAGVAGELGCSDIPGWGDTDARTKLDKTTAPVDQAGKSGSSGGDMAAQNLRHADSPRESDSQNGKGEARSDGTDDHLHHPLPESVVGKTSAEKRGESIEGKPAAHADIQSIQESAEIAGKIVLLSRGGCGFLEKVKWVQRRGGTALIVGDDTRGGSLVTMYAHGDTSNVTIPSLFTSHTTAQLLSSLLPPQVAGDSNSNAGTKVSTARPAQSSVGKQRVATTTTSVISTPTPSRDSVATGPVQSASRAPAGVVHNLLSSLGLSNHGRPWHLREDSRRPPSSGNIDWVVLDRWEEEESSSEDSRVSAGNSQSRSKISGVLRSSKKSGSKTANADSDEFVIGVHDWRDPDLLLPKSSNLPTPSTTVNSQYKDRISSHAPTSLKGGSITPGSGEYYNVELGSSKDSSAKSRESMVPAPQAAPPSGKGWLSRHLSWTEDKELDSASSGGSQPKPSAGASPQGTSRSQDRLETDEHEGLWVTLTPTSMSTSPFFDTLLVLVISPLLTLSIVYALLLLRSRIRRRRWRAPKSLVDRLPVRTYHTIVIPSPPSSTDSRRSPSPNPALPTSPLLGSRPRSQLSGIAPDVSESSRDSAKEKSTSSSVWRRKYTGKQVECVVCLEEYIDGQSRVMSLPCGHEFHAECM